MINTITQPLSIYMNTTFMPPLIIANRHVQTTLTSLQLRKYLAGRRAARLLQKQKELILDCGDGVRLQGYLSEAPNRDIGLVTLIHGWEGSSDSSYILSAARALHEAGFSVFRLNLRDHGNSHHLNAAPFNSSRLGEVIGAVAGINALIPHKRAYLAGFSLGGNFALRLAIAAPSHNLQLTKVVAISPLIDPLTTTKNMEENHKIYHHYFVKKWKKSLRKKMAAYPEIDDASVLLRLKTLKQMHDYFVPRHTNSKTTREYFSTYRLGPDSFDSLKIPSHIITSEDDPITRAEELREIIAARIPLLHIKMSPSGGHCGFIQDLHLTSWIDRELVTLFQHP